MLLTDFDFDLPEALIAQAPPENRADARMLEVRVADNALEDLMFRGLLSRLRRGDLLVMNNTQVVPARMHGRKETGGRVEILLERLLDDERALVQIKASKTPQSGSLIYLDEHVCIRVEARRDSFFEISSENGPLSALMDQFGHIPLPPYIRRADQESDRERYQTVYARHPGSVAAPTAGLHFSEYTMDQLDHHGIDVGYVTLHVGAGTFQPIRTDTVETHKMHSERYVVSEKLCDQVNTARREGRRVISVGTTSVRCLESAFDSTTGLLAPGSGETDIFLYPGRTIHVPDGLLTNFHLPQSTLIMLVSAFAGLDLVKRAYRHAVEQEYRFFSYGDAMLLWR